MNANAMQSAADSVQAQRAEFYRPRRLHHHAVVDLGRPSEFGKSFAKSAPVGPVHRATDVGHIAEGEIALTVNGQMRQDSDINKLIWSVSECIAYRSEYETLEPGDIIMSGTPEGVNAVQRGDLINGSIAGLGEIVVGVAG